MALTASVDIGGGKVLPLDEAARARLARLHDERAERGYRLLAVAWKRLPRGHKEIRSEDERDRIIAGFCVFVDPPKAGAADAIGRLARAGIHIKLSPAIMRWWSAIWPKH